MLPSCQAFPFGIVGLDICLSQGMIIFSCSSYIPSLDFSKRKNCEHCLYDGKQTLSSHSHVISQRSEPLELVHSDICGPMPIVSMGGAQHFVTFIDDYSRKVWAYLLWKKDQGPLSF